MAALTNNTTAPGRSVRRWPYALLIALTMVVTLESFRLLFPSLYGLRERSSLFTVLVVFLVVAIVPLLAPLFGRLLGPRRGIALFVLLLALWRLLVQLLDPVAVATAAAGSIVGLMALTLALSCPQPEAGTRGGGLIAGLGLDVVLSGAFVTWEPAWQSGIAPLAIAVALAVALVVVGAVVYRRWAPAEAGTASGPGLARGMAVGAVVALEVLFLANSAYLAAAGGLALSWAIAVTATGATLALAGWVLAVRGGVVPAAVGAALLTAAGFLLPALTGAAALVVVLAAQLGAGMVLARALASAGSGAGRAGIGLALGWVLGLVVILLFQLHFDSPLPIDNRYLTALLGLLALLALVRARVPAPGSAPRWPWVAVGGATVVAGLLLAVALAVTEPSPAAVAAPDDPVRVLQWNVRYGVDEDGQLDPEAVARSIEAQGDVDVVVLNEVARGWPLSGQLDLAGWMSRRLGLNAVWGAAAGPQAGNLLLTRYPVLESEITTLPKAGRAMGRSLLYASLGRGGGEALEVLATHLQHRNDAASMAARLEEIEVILQYWDEAPATVLVGDLNPKQGDPPEYPERRPGEFEEIARLLDAGFVTAANLEACDPPTSNDNCSDYILVGPDLEQESLTVGDLFADHHMVVADVSGFGTVGTRGEGRAAAVGLPPRAWGRAPGPGRCWWRLRRTPRGDPHGHQRQGDECRLPRGSRKSCAAHRPCRSRPASPETAREGGRPRE